jgi:hypothetical protein
VDDVGTWLCIIAGAKSQYIITGTKLLVDCQEVSTFNYISRILDSTRLCVSYNVMLEAWRDLDARYIVTCQMTPWVCQASLLKRKSRWNRLSRRVSDQCCALKCGWHITQIPIASSSHWVFIVIGSIHIIDQSYRLSSQNFCWGA